METPDFFRREALACRRNAANAPPGLERRGLIQLAAYYEGEARRLELAEIARNSENVIVLDRAR